MSLVDQLFEPDPAHIPTRASGPAVELSIPRQELLNLLILAQAVIPTRDAMPVLKHVQLQATNAILLAVATDMALWQLVTTTNVAIRRPGTVVLPVRKTIDILRTVARDDTIHLAITHATATITAATTSWTLRVPSGADFPDSPAFGDAVSVTLPGDALARAITAVAYAAGSTATHPGLAAIDIRDNLVTASDGARFAQTRLSGTPPQPVTLPLPAARHIETIGAASTGDPVTMTLLDRHIAIRSDLMRGARHQFLAARHLHPYPDLTSSLLRPTLANRHELIIEPHVLADALTRVRHTLNPDTHGIALTLDHNGATVESRDQHANTTVDAVPAGWAGKPRTITCHLGHLTDLVTAHRATHTDVDGTVPLTFFLGEDTHTRRSPLLYRSENTVAVIPQMHLDWATR